MADTHDEYVTDARKYAPAPDEAAVGGIAKHLGIALRNRDASVVAGTDPEELKRVRESFLRKKLGLAQSDAELDAAIKDVLHKLQGVREKHRVTVYYLLAEKFGELDAFHGKEAGHGAQ
jgi:hypothetical protein